MIRTNHPGQLDIFDKWGFLSPKRRKMLDSSWAGLFREAVLPSLLNEPRRKMQKKRGDRQQAVPPCSLVPGTGIEPVRLLRAEGF